MTDPAATLGAVPLFAAATPAELQDLARSAAPRHLTRGQVLFTAGDPSTHLFVVVRGTLAVLVSSERGDTFTLSVLGPGDVLGELSTVDGQPRSASVEARSDTDLLALPARAVRRLLEQSPRVALTFAEVLAARVRALTGSATDLVFLDLAHRLAKLLANTAGDEVALSQAQLATQLGVARPSLNRALNTLAARGWVHVARARLRVTDRAALAAYAASGYDHPDT